MEESLLRICIKAKAILIINTMRKQVHVYFLWIFSLRLYVMNLPYEAQMLDHITGMLDTLFLSLNR